MPSSLYKSEYKSKYKYVDFDKIKIRKGIITNRKFQHPLDQMNWITDIIDRSNQRYKTVTTFLCWSYKGLPIGLRTSTGIISIKPGVCVLSVHDLKLMAYQSYDIKNNLMARDPKKSAA